MNTFALRRCSLSLATALVAGVTLFSTASAHMPWLATDDQGRAVMWFGESPDDRAYHMPDKVAAIVLSADGVDAAIKTVPVDTDHLIGIQSAEGVVADREINGTVTYGLYHGMKLTYHVEHLPQKDPAGWPSQPRANAVLQSVVSASPEGGVIVSVLSHGKPAKGVSVKLYCEEGHEEGQAETDEAGLVTFSKSQVEEGLNGLVIGMTNKEDAGTLDGEAYGSSADYLTATFFYPGKKGAQEKTAQKDDKPKVDPSSDVSIVPSGLPELPEELTSFGAAIAADHVFVYGGHTGSAHSYSNKEQSNRLWSLDLKDKGAKWTEMTAGPRLQGLALVQWKDQVIRIGGFTAVNEEGDDHDLRSQTSVASFDTESKAWSDLAPLPEPRSSLDAAVLGDKVYVFGGWQLNGASEDSVWHQSALSLDLSDSNATWQSVAKPPFQRRAISVAAHGGKLYVIGGMQSKGGPTTQVAVYDPSSDSWSTGPSIPGSGMSGFGSSAFDVDGNLYVSAMDGFVHQLSADGKSWGTVAKMDPARFFHRMIPLDGNLLLIGGANMQIGKFTAIDLVKRNND